MKKFNKLLSAVALIGVIIPLNVSAITKSETIYASVNSEGQNYKQIVSTHLYNNVNGDIEDTTNLTDILNINGDEKFALDGNKLTWSALGKDIFYQGKSNIPLPISLKVNYYLNGEKIDSKKLKGQKGDIKIELKFTNNTILKSTNDYVPFVVTAGAIINNENNSNIKINNGTVVDTGSKSYVLGLASPGLYEFMGLAEFSDFDMLTIEYTTESFSLNDIYVVSTPKFIESSDFSIFSKINALASSTKTIKDNMDKIEEGSNALLKGAEALDGGAYEIAAGLKTVSAGMSALVTGADNLNQGLSETLLGLNTSIDNLNKMLAMLNDSANPMSLPNLKALIKQDEDTLTALKVADPTNPLITLLATNKMALENMLATFDSISKDITSNLSLLQGALTELEAGSNKLSLGLKEVKAGVDKLEVGADTLKGGSEELYTGMQTLSSGVSTLNKEGITVLNNYASTFVGISNRAQNVLQRSINYKGFTADNIDKTTIIYKVSINK